MELTIDQALQQGIAAHKEGNLQNAEKLYRAILTSQPNHPDANHNLGVIAVSVKKSDAALPLFKIALEANPNVEQFWLSYIDALITGKQFSNASQVLEQAKNHGVGRKKLDALAALLSYTTRIAVDDSKSPPQEQLNMLLAHYQNGRLRDAENLAASITQEYPDHPFGWKALGAVLGQLGRNLEAVNAIQTAVTLSPQDAISHNNLGNTLAELGRLEEAEASYRQAIGLKLDYVEAHGNLGITLKELGRLEEAEASYRQAIKLKLDYVEAHSNLGNTLQELGRLEEAESSYGQAIKLQPDYAEAYSNLGSTLQKLGRLEDAEANYRRAIASKPNLAEAYLNLARVLYGNGFRDLALKRVEQANNIDPQLKPARLLLHVLKSRTSRENNRIASVETRKINAAMDLDASPLILNRVVEAELLGSIYGMSSKELDDTSDARYGNGICSPDFNLFKDSSPIIQKVAEDLTKIMMEAVQSEIFIFDSFYNILGAGGGSTPHMHLGNIDIDIGLNIGKQKYSLVYYLDVGDQNCSEPGVLKLYDPAEDILPCDGMITIISASRKHSAVYNGKTDRVMIGVNFYSI